MAAILSSEFSTHFGHFLVCGIDVTGGFELIRLIWLAGGFPAQSDSNAHVSMWWRHNGIVQSDPAKYR